MNAHISSLRQTWQARPTSERRRLLLGLSLIVLLGGYLLVDHWPNHSVRHASPSTALIEQALTRLPPQPKLTSPDWRTAASRQGVVIQRLETTPDGWQLSGLLSQPEDFQQLSRWAAQQGLWPYTYQLSREAEGWHWQAQFMNLQAIVRQTMARQTMKTQDKAPLPKPSEQEPQ